MKRKTEGRSVPLHPEARKLIKVWIKELETRDGFSPTLFLFPSRKSSNRSISRRHALRILSEAFERMGLDGSLGTHSMRKTFANRVYRHLCKRRAAGEPVDPFRLTSKALGHKSITSTDQYLSFLDEDVTRAILAD